VNIFRRAINWINAMVYQNGEFVQVLGGGYVTRTGKAITPMTALQTIAVLRCVRLIAEAGASLPIDVYEKRGGKRRSVDDHPVEYLLDVEPNNEMSAMDFRVMMWASLLLWGNGYARIARAGDGRPVALWPLAPAAMTIERLPSNGIVEGGLVYIYRANGEDVRYQPSEILHIRGFSVDGISGLSPIALAREGIALNQSAEEYGSRYYQHGARPSVHFEYPGKLSPEAYKNLSDSLQNSFGGLQNAHRIMLTEEGLKATALQINPRDSQFLEQRQFNDEQIAMLFGVPPHMIGLVSKSTSWGTGIEQQTLGFVTYTLAPLIAYWEHDVRRKLFDRKSGLYIKHNLAAFLRADIKTRFEAYGHGVDKGIFNRNEVRAWEDLDPYPGGEVYTVQSQMIPIQLAGKPQPKPGQEPA
jgi:HK97 family phage portal protein